MKYSFRKFLTVMIIMMIVVSSSVFAKGSSEQNSANEVVEVTEKSEEKESEDIKENSLIKEYENEVLEFEKKYNEIVARLELAYDKNDATAYSEAKKELKTLQYPYLTEERSKAIEATIAEDDYSTAAWLFRNSRYYHPVLQLESRKDNFNYYNSIATNPGSEVTLPELRTYNGLYKFAGWGKTEDKVDFKAGETLKMPVSDMTLYAVFERDESIKEGKDLTISDKNTLELERNKQVDFSFKIKNSGSETLSNLNIVFDSDDPLLVVLDNSLSCRYLPSAREVVAGYKVITKAAEGTQLKGLITITDADNSTWTDEVVFTVK